MTTIHFPEVPTSGPISTPKRRNWKKIGIGAAIAAILVVPTAAYAAIELFGFGQFNSEVGTTKVLTIDTMSLTSSLVPGQTSGAKGVVHNSNDFPVTVTSVIIRKTGMDFSGLGCDPNTLHPFGVVVHAGGDVGDGWETVLPTPITVPANGASWVTLDKALSQDAAASALCGVQANVAVRVEVGS